MDKSQRNRDAKGRFVTAAKKVPAEKRKALDFQSMQVSGAVISAFLGMTQSAVTQQCNMGVIRQNADGTFPLVDTVRDYIARMREERRNAAPGDKDGLDAQQSFWKTEKLKQQVRTWRVQRDRATALAVVEQIRSAMLQLRERLKDVRGIGRDFDELLAAVDSVDVEAACAVVESEDEEDE